MARTLYLDCFAGISGDMFIGALLDCGLDFKFLKTELAKLGLDEKEYHLHLSRVDRSGISASKFDVHLKHEHKHDHGHAHEHHHHDHEHTHEHHHHDQAHTHQHSHEHHVHDHDHHHDHAHEHHHEHIHTDDHHHRSLSNILKLIDSSSLSDNVKNNARKLFQRIGEAEAKIHNIPVENIHFHEVGAVDSIVDIVGACIGLEALGIDKVISSPLHVGSGTIKIAHGTYPVPAPATAEILKGAPIYAGEIKGELVTPTGAAIVSVLASSFGPMPMMKIEQAGYGAGTKTFKDFPNVLRAVIGETEDTDDSTPETITVLEANIDDLNPQVFGHIMNLVLDAGALDIFYTPIQMKKNRPAILMTVLCKPEDRIKISELIFKETTTLGIRYRNEQRIILKREFVTVETKYGAIRIKVAKNQDGRIVNYSPEFEECKIAAELHGVSIREVQSSVISTFTQTF